MTNAGAVEALAGLGFGALEAEVYAFLVREAPATGYRVAQALCRPAANVYKAIEALEARGAVMVDHGASRLCRATPPDELLGQLHRQFQQRRTEASRVLRELHDPSSDDRIYHLRSRGQVLERAGAMLEGCRAVALVDAFPGPLMEITPGLEAAAARGVRVTVKAYLPASLQGAAVVMNPRGEEVMRRYPGESLILLVDGLELLIASFVPGSGEVQQAVWTASVPLSYIVHGAMAAEVVICSLMEHITAGVTMDQLRAAVEPITRSGVVPDPARSGEVGASMAPLAEFYRPDLPGFLALWRQAAGRPPDAPDPAVPGEDNPT